MRHRKLKDELNSSWYIPLRLSIFLLLFGAVVLTESKQASLLPSFLVYSIATLLFLLVIQLKARLVKPGFLRWVVLGHLFFELIVEGAIVRSAGALTSQYSVLFLLTIVSASLVFRLAGTLSVATLASGIYALTSVANRFPGVSGLLNLEQVKFAYQVNDEVFYAVFLHVCTFYLVAFISGFLAERLRIKEGELSHASQRLERAQLDTDDILLNLHSGLISLDNQGEIVYFNRAAESIIGMKQSDVKGRNFADVFREPMPEFCERVLSVLQLAKPNVRTEVEIIGKSGNKIPLGLSISVLGDERTHLRGVIAIFQDLTLAKEMEQALMNADRLATVGELSARIAHEIRNPLASISGSVQVLQNEINFEGENARLMRLIVKESDRLSRILSDFLTYARTTPVRSEKVELVSLTADTIELVRKNPNVPGSIAVNFFPDSATCYVRADDDQLRQVLMNLILNAVEAVDPLQGKINIQISSGAASGNAQEKKQVVLLIGDNGCGMTREEQRRIFEPFFSGKRGGTGLGLAIVKRCLDNMGGSIEVESASGKGTTVTVKLCSYSLARSPESEGSGRIHNTLAH